MFEESGFKFNHSASVAWDDCILCACPQLRVAIPTSSRIN